MDEWSEADDAAQLVGHSAVSFLSDSLKLYFKALEKQLGFSLNREDKATAKKEDKATAKKKGFLEAYRAAIGGVLKTDWTDCPVRFDIIEQVVLARNRVQHGEDLATPGARHDRETLTKHREPVFASKRDLKIWENHGATPDSFPDPGADRLADRIFAPQVEITGENLGLAITEVERLADWITDARHP